MAPRKQFVPRTSARQARFRRSVHAPSTRSVLPGIHHDRTSRRPRLQRILRITLPFILALTAVVGLPLLSARLAHRGPVISFGEWFRTADAGVTVHVWGTRSQTLASLPLNEYLFEALAAELTPGTPAATLQATAVADRTYVIHAMKTPGQATPAHAHHADVTDDGGVDLPLMSESNLATLYLDSEGGEWTAQIKLAIEATDGQVLTYKDEPILAFTTLMTPGKTRDAKMVFGSSIPYLVARACPADLTAPDRISKLTFGAEDLRQALHLANVAANQVRVESRSTDGYVTYVAIANKRMTGSEFASELHLPSDDFSLNTRGASLVVTVVGHGTGLGMSLHEAAQLATDGEGSQAILRYFYPGTNIETLKNMGL